MSKVFGALKVELREDTISGLRVSPVQSDHDGLYPVVSSLIADRYSAWMGITAEAGKAGDIVSVFPPYSGLVMARIECETAGCKTGWWANTETNGYFTCNHGGGQIATGVIVTPELDEEASAGKIVKAMIFTARFVFDQKSP